MDQGYNEYKFFMLKAIVIAGKRQPQNNDEVCLSYTELVAHLQFYMSEDFDQIIFDNNIIESVEEELLHKVERPQHPGNALYFESVLSFAQFQFLPVHHDHFLADVDDRRINQDGFSCLASIIPDLKDEIYELTFGHVPVYYDPDIFASTNAPKLWPKNVDNQLRLRFGESNTLRTDSLQLCCNSKRLDITLSSLVGLSIERYSIISLKQTLPSKMIFLTESNNFIYNFPNFYRHLGSSPIQKI